VVFHIAFLHETGSSSQFFSHSHENKIKFNYLFIVKDVVNLVFFLPIIIFLLYFPYILGDAENFILANYLMSPLHIQPEWYFLFAYAILRSIPNKLGGVIALVASVIIFYFFVFFPLKQLHRFKNKKILF
jgi:ubiquinol-cytochrome c reductase cytochrome b subunit